MSEQRLLTYAEALAAAGLVAAYPFAQRAIMDRWLDWPADADWDGWGLPDNEPEHSPRVLQLLLRRLIMAGYVVDNAELSDIIWAAYRVGVAHISEIARVKGVEWRCPAQGVNDV